MFVFPHPLVNLHKGSRSAAVPLPAAFQRRCGSCRAPFGPGPAGAPAAGRGCCPGTAELPEQRWGCRGWPTLRDTSSLGPQHAARGGYGFLALPPARLSCQFLRICIPRALPAERRRARPHLLRVAVPRFAAPTSEPQPPTAPSAAAARGPACDLPQEKPLFPPPLSQWHTAQDSVSTKRHPEK